MQGLMQHDARALPDQEGAALLRWLADGMLTQLGHVTRHRDGSVTEALGICRATARRCCPMPLMPAPLPGSTRSARAARKPCAFP
jgi:hypothetical protein